MKVFKYFTIKLGALITLLFSSVLIAAPLTPQEKLPTTVGPAQVGESVTPRTPFDGTLPPETMVHVPHGQQLSPEMAKLKFKLTNIKFINCQIYSCETLTAPFKHLIGKTITLAELQDIANSMTKYYQQEGYVLTQVIIPPQQIKDGVVTLQVIGGFIDKVSVSGDIQPELKSLLMRYGCIIKDSKPLQMKVLERYLLLANDIPGLNVRTVLTPSKTTPGAGDLTFVSTQKCFGGYAEMNNFGTKYIGQPQFLDLTEGYSLFQPGDSTQLFFITTGSEELNYGQIQYSELLCDEGLRYNVVGRYLVSEPGSTLAPFFIRSYYKVIGNDLSYPIIRSRRENLTIKGSFAVIDSKAILLGAPFYTDRIRPLALGFLYDYWDSFQGVNQAEVVASQGLKILHSPGPAPHSRPNGSASFTKLNATLSRLQTLPDRFSLMLLAIGQYSFQPLFTVSQIGFGGNYIGRGYDPSEILGDQGLMGSAELRYDILYPCDTRVVPQIYGFYDIGKVWNIDSTIVSAASTGGGIRLQIQPQFSANLFVGKPLTKIVSSTGNRHPRIFFSIHATY